MSLLQKPKFYWTGHESKRLAFEGGPIELKVKVFQVNNGSFFKNNAISQVVVVSQSAQALPPVPEICGSVEDLMKNVTNKSTDEYIVKRQGVAKFKKKLK